MAEDTPRRDKKFVAHIPGDLEELIPGYLEGKRENVKTMLEALGRDDFETIRVIGHDMKGSGAGYGFEDITRIGRDIERWAVEKKAHEIRACVSELSTYLENVEVVFVE